MQFLVMMYVGQAFLAAVLAAVLTSYFRLYRRTWLRSWALSWGAFAVYLLGGLAGVLGTRSLPPDSVIRLSIAFVALAAGYLQLSWLLFGVADLVAPGRYGRGQRRVTAVVLLLAAAVLTALYAGDPALGPARMVSRVGVRSLASGMAFLAAGGLIWSHRARGRVGQSLVGIAFCVYGVDQLAYAVAFTAPLLTGTSLLGDVTWLAPVDLVLEALMGLGMIMWLLEDERGRALGAERAESARRHALAAVVEHSADPAWIVDTDLRVVAANASFRERYHALTGVRLASGTLILDAMAPDLQDRWRPLYGRALAGESLTVEHESRVSPSPQTLEVSLEPVAADDGRIAGVSIMARDITNARRAEAGRAERAADAERAHRLESLGALAGGIAHDFNNILAVILANAQLIRQDTPVAHAAIASLDDIETRARQGADLTRQLLAYTGQTHLALQPLDVSALVEGATAVLQHAIDGRGELRLALDRAVPMVPADPAQLRQVLMNLVTNAAESLHAPGGVITVRTATAPAPSGRHVLLEVVDTGIGMPDDVKERLFEPFHSTKFTGRGLGLAVALAIVRRHGGELTVDSRPDGGTTVRILLPVPDTAVTAPDTPVRRSGGAVLIVDDEPAIRRAASRILTRLKYATLEAGDGIEGLAMLDVHDVDAVILDLTMPRLDGHAMLREVRRTRPTLPIIICSGYGEDTGPVLDEHTAFVHKPFEVGTLVETLRDRFGVMPSTEG